MKKEEEKREEQEEEEEEEEKKRSQEKRYGFLVWNCMDLWILYEIMCIWTMVRMFMVCKPRVFSKVSS